MQLLDLYGADAHEAGHRVAVPRRPDAAPVPFARRGSVARETADTFTLSSAPARAQPFPFAPGQFNMLYAFGVGEVPISISGDPAAPGELLHTIRAVGAATTCAAEAGDGATMVGVRGPFGTILAGGRRPTAATW